MSASPQMSTLDTASLGLDPRFAQLSYDPGTMSVGGSVNWVVILVVVLVSLVLCCSCLSFMYAFRFQIYNLIRPGTIKVEGYNYKGREIPDEYSGY